MSDVHSAAAVTLQTHGIEGFSVGFTIRQQLLEFFPLVGDNAAATETSYWNNHLLTSSIGLLLLATSTTSKLVLWFLASGIVDQKAAIKAKIFIAEFLINSLCSAVVVDQATCNGGSDSVGLTRASSTRSGYRSVDYAPAAHRVGDAQGLHWLS